MPVELVCECRAFHVPDPRAAVVSADREPVARAGRHREHVRPRRPGPYRQAGGDVPQRDGAVAVGGGEPASEGVEREPRPRTGRRRNLQLWLEVGHLRRACDQDPITLPCCRRWILGFRSRMTAIPDDGVLAAGRGSRARRRGWDGRYALTGCGRSWAQGGQQGSGEAVGVVRPIAGFLGEHGQHDRVQLVGNAGPQGAQAGRRCVHVLVHDLPCLAPRERRPAGQQLMQHAAQRVQIAAPIDLRFSFALFG